LPIPQKREGNIALIIAIAAASGFPGRMEIGAETLFPGATARCNDYTYSHSRHPYAWGTCSYHGGVHDYVGAVTGISQTPWRQHQHRPSDPEEIPILSVPVETPLR
jgi:hypothetical protein